MKCSMSLLLPLCLALLLGSNVCDAQTRTYSSTTVILHYPQPVVTRGVASGPTQPFSPSGVTTPMNGTPTTRVLNELDLMNTSFIVKAKSLPPTLYASFSSVANSMRHDTARSAMLRRLIYELPSRMEGTRYIPPSPESMMQAMRKVVYSTDAQVQAFWLERTMR